MPQNAACLHGLLIQLTNVVKHVYAEDIGAHASQQYMRDQQLSPQSDVADGSMATTHDHQAEGQICLVCTTCVCAMH